MALLQDILYKIPLRAVKGNTGITVSDLQTDSRKVSAGTAFIAVKGTVTDGHDYIEQAVAAGAVAIICGQMPEQLHEQVTYIQVADSAQAAGLMAHNFYGEPSLKIKLTGVTGTNGKTTVATLLYKLFTKLGYKAGLISTVQNHVGEKIIPASHTTPDAISLNALLAQMAEEGCTHVFMEVSSHAIHQQRIAGLRFEVAVFTNITHDHLDYHKTFDEYIRVKKSFFDNLPADSMAITNADDKRGMIMIQNTQAAALRYSLKTAAPLHGKILDNSLNGLEMMVNGLHVHFRLIGEFNAYNIMAVFGAASSLGIPIGEIMEVLSSLEGAEGRFETVISPKDRVMGIIDYAHTPDALINVLSTIQKLKQRNERVIAVVGCGGDRDKTKRPLMAAAACEYSDSVIFTSDNPRSEDPQQIINDMTADMKSAHKRKYIAIPDRREAIKAAINLAESGDVVLVAGKGHEKYQEIKGIKYPFDDKEILKELFKQQDR